MSYELDETTLDTRANPEADRATIATGLRFLAEEYVMARHWSRADQLLTICEQVHAAADTGDEMEEWLAKISFAMKPLLAEDCWKAYRQGLRDLATNLGLDPGNYKKALPTQDADPE